MEKLSHTTESIIDENVEMLASLFPEVVTEVREPDGSLRHTIDVDALKERVGDVAEGQRERYQFTWPGKREAKQEAYRQIDKCLRPCPEESVNWDTTQNLYIEGDNLDALKLLRNTYAGKVKMIYIDPPYNTGHDFIYDDDFSRSKADYDTDSGDYDEEGGRLVANPESNGRFHSDWCSMMYPRLLLARDLLSEDGVIGVSLDNSEVANLRRMLEEIFGAENILSQVCVNRTSEIASNFTVDKHEYLFLCLKSRNDFTLTSKTKFTTSRGTVGNRDQTMPVIEFPAGLRCEGIPDGIYETTRKIDGSLENIENYDSICIENGLLKYPVKLKARWRSSNDMRNFFSNGCHPTKAKINGEIVDIYFNNDRFCPQIVKKTYEKIPSVFFDNKRGSDELKRLGLLSIFDFPKSTVLVNFALQVTRQNDTVLDFFSGSATTAHAVMQLNAEDGCNRKFIMVQLPEVCDEKSEAAKAGYKNICEIGKERIRRAGKKIAAEVEESNRQLKLGEEPKKVPDIGFRVLKIDSSNFEDVSAEPGEFSQDAMLRFADNLKLDRTPDDLIIQVMLKKQIELSAPIEKLDVDDCTVFSIDGGRLVACFDRDVPVEVMTAMAKMEPDYAVMRDASFAGDDAVSNFAEIFKNYSSITEVEVI